MRHHKHVGQIQVMGVLVYQISGLRVKLFQIVYDHYVPLGQILRIVSVPSALDNLWKFCNPVSFFRGLFLFVKLYSGITINDQHPSYQISKIELLVFQNDFEEPALSCF